MTSTELPASIKRRNGSQQLRDVVEMQTRSGLIEQKERPSRHAVDG